MVTIEWLSLVINVARVPVIYVNPDDLISDQNWFNWLKLIQSVTKSSLLMNGVWQKPWIETEKIVKGNFKTQFAPFHTWISWIKLPDVWEFDPKLFWQKSSFRRADNESALHSDRLPNSAYARWTTRSAFELKGIPLKAIPLFAWKI